MVHFRAGLYLRYNRSMYEKSAAHTSEKEPCEFTKEAWRGNDMFITMKAFLEDNILNGV